jgi:hypothetical protein
VLVAARDDERQRSRRAVSPQVTSRRINAAAMRNDLTQDRQNAPPTTVLAATVRDETCRRSELGGQVKQAKQTSSTRRNVVVALLAAAGITAAWWFTATHPGMYLTGGEVGGTACFDPVATAGTELIRGGITFDPPADATVLAVRLVEPENIELADARVAPLTTGAPGDQTTIGTATGWPLEERERYAMDWTADRELVGAHLRGGVTEVPYLHLHVVDPLQPVSLEGWQVEYRMRATKWVSTLGTAVKMPVEPATCNDL